MKTHFKVSRRSQKTCCGIKITKRIVAIEMHQRSQRYDLCRNCLKAKSR